MVSAALRRLAERYGVTATVEQVADAIIARTLITSGVSERLATVALLRLLLEHPSVLLGVERGEPWPEDLTEETVHLVARYSPEMGAEAFVDVVLRDLGRTLRVGHPV